MKGAHLPTLSNVIESCEGGFGDDEREARGATRIDSSKNFGGTEKAMPELRGIQATPEVKEEWKRAYAIYLRAPGDRYDKKKDRTERINFVADEMRLTRKQAKRRVRNYEAWQRNIKKGLVERG
jgi:hypothetical protein